MYYRSVKTGKILNDEEVSCLNLVYGPNELNRCLTSKTLEPVENPSVIDLLLHRSKVAAAVRYVELHEDYSMTIPELYDRIEQMEMDLRKCRARRYNKNRKVEEKNNGRT